MATESVSREQDDLAGDSDDGEDTEVEKPSNAIGSAIFKVS